MGTGYIRAKTPKDLWWVANLKVENRRDMSQAQVVNIKKKEMIRCLFHNDTCLKHL